MTLALPRRATILAATGWLASCASPSPSLYTLDIPPGQVRRGGPKAIELRAIGLARYLERPQIVRSSENFRLDVLPNDWWGEPLDAMIGRVLARALSQRLPGGTVYLENSAISTEPGATVQVNVQRLDRDSSGSVTLIAQFAVHRGAGAAQGVTFQVPVRDATAAGLVAAMSDAIGLLADRIAAALAA